MLTAGLALLGVGAAPAEPPGWTTVPDPNDSFGWKAERPARTPQPQSQPTRASSLPPAPAPATMTAPTPSHHAASKRTRARRAREGGRHGTPTVRRKLIVKSQRTGAVLAARATDSSGIYRSALLLAALALAIACLACGATPATQIRWPRGAAFVAYQRANITTVGLISLLAAAIVFALTRN